MESRLSFRHAYFIMAHTNFDQLQQLIDLLDDPDNDIYLHIDQRSQVDLSRFHTEHSALIFIPRMKITWGGHSQTLCELELMKAAAKQHYQYYHLISGLDLPIKSQEEIHSFFTAHNGQNFIDFDAVQDPRLFEDRVNVYYFMQDHIGRREDGKYRIFGWIEHLSLMVQKLFRIQRSPCFPLYKGANWFSITDDMVQFILRQEKQIRKQFCYGRCADELFLQSAAMASPYADTLSDFKTRTIDWNRGDPYVYRTEDVKALLASSGLFGRKFDNRVDPAAVSQVYSALKG